MTCDNYFGDRLSDVNSVGDKGCPFPLTSPVAVNTTQPMIVLRTATSCNINVVTYSWPNVHVSFVVDIVDEN